MRGDDDSQTRNPRIGIDNVRSLVLLYCTWLDLLDLASLEYLHSLFAMWQQERYSADLASGSGNDHDPALSGGVIGTICESSETGARGHMAWRNGCDRGRDSRSDYQQNQLVWKPVDGSLLY